MADFNKVLAQGSGLKYLGGERSTQNDQPLTTLYYEDRGSAILVAVHFAGAAEALQVRMQVLIEGEPPAVAEVVAEMRVGELLPNPRQALFTFADLFTGNDPIGFAGMLRRVQRVATGKLAAAFGPDLAVFESVRPRLRS